MLQLQPNDRYRKVVCMVKLQTKDMISDIALRIFAARGYDGLSMRALAAASGIGLSSIYHFYTDKDVLLHHIFTMTNIQLGQERRLLKPRQTAEAMLQDRIRFQFEHMEQIVFIIKYYLHYRDDFLRKPEKVLPSKAYLHIEEVLHKGILTGEFSVPATRIGPLSRIITHSINGFMLEYYPQQLQAAERKQLTHELTEFTMRSLKFKEAPM